jgi:hypothetical protein
MVARISQAMEFLRLLPDHCQAPEMRGAISEWKRDLPHFWALADIEVRKQHVTEDELLHHPEQCPHCHGSGRRLYPRARFEAFCGCLLGQAMERGVSLSQHAYDCGITETPAAAAPCQQLALIGLDFIPSAVSEEVKAESCISSAVSEENIGETPDISSTVSEGMKTPRPSKGRIPRVGEWAAEARF